MYMGKQQERTAYAHVFVFPTNMFIQPEKTITQIQIVGHATRQQYVMSCKTEKSEKKKGAGEEYSKLKDT